MENNNNNNKNKINNKYIEINDTKVVSAYEEINFSQREIYLILAIIILLAIYFISYIIYKFNS